MEESLKSTCRVRFLWGLDVEGRPLEEGGILLCHGDDGKLEAQVQLNARVLVRGLKMASKMCF